MNPIEKQIETSVEQVRTKLGLVPYVEWPCWYHPGDDSLYVISDVVYNHEAGPMVELKKLGSAVKIVATVSWFEKVFLRAVTSKELDGLSRSGQQNKSQ